MEQNNAAFHHLDEDPISDQQKKRDNKTIDVDLASPSSVDAAISVKEEKYEIKWIKYILILGKPPPLTARQWKVFGLLALAGMFSTYDDTLKSVAVDQIQESLDIDDGEISYVIAIIRMGVIFALILNLTADKIGRRPMVDPVVEFLIRADTCDTLAPRDNLWVCAHDGDHSRCNECLLVYTRTVYGQNVHPHRVSALNKCVPEPLLSCLMVRYLLSNISILEEFDTGDRGWAVGAISSLCVMGSALCIIMYGPLGSYEYGNWKSNTTQNRDFKV
eukprot:36011-Amorphochlora_amoeboformis.AAC.1